MGHLKANDNKENETQVDGGVVAKLCIVYHRPQSKCEQDQIIRHCNEAECFGPPTHGLPFLLLFCALPLTSQHCGT
jgi:hypothetical protein